MNLRTLLIIIVDMFFEYTEEEFSVLRMHFIFNKFGFKKKYIEPFY